MPPSVKHLCDPFYPLFCANIFKEVQSIDLRCFSMFHYWLEKYEHKLSLTRKLIQAEIWVACLALILWTNEKLKWSNGGWSKFDSNQEKNL